MAKHEITQSTAEEITSAAQTVQDSYDPETGRLPKELFCATSYAVPRDTIELAIYSFDKRQVLLTDREDDDPHFAGKLHLPGVMLVPTDATSGPYPDAMDNAAVRAIEELGGTRITSLLRLSPRWVNQPARLGPRGVEIPTIYCAHLVDEEPAVGGMFDVDNPPENIYEHHPFLIKAAQEAINPAHAMDLRII